MKLLFDERIFFHVKVSGKIICLSSAVPLYFTERPLKNPYEE